MASAPNSYARCIDLDGLAALTVKEGDDARNIHRSVVSESSFDPLEVPFESLKIRRAFDDKDAHKSQMKLSAIRRGSLIGTRHGDLGFLTYGDYLDDDVTLMTSIHSNEFSPDVRTGTSAEARKESLVVIPSKSSGPNDALTKALEEKCDVIPPRSSCNANYGATAFKEKSTKGCSCPFSYGELVNDEEIPYYELYKKKRHSWRKASMMQSSLRQSGLCGNLSGDSLGFVVYGSFGGGDSLVF